MMFNNSKFNQPQTSEVNYSSIPEQSNFEQTGPSSNWEAPSMNLQQFWQPALIEIKKEGCRELIS